MMRENKSPVFAFSSAPSSKTSARHLVITLLIPSLPSWNRFFVPPEAKVLKTLRSVVAVSKIELTVNSLPVCSRIESNAV